MVWLAACGGTGWLFLHRAQRCELVGIARAETRQIAALMDGRLRVMPIELFDTVKAGQTLAVLEDDRIQAALATAAAESARARAELTATENRLIAAAGLQSAEQLAESRRFAIDVEKCRLRELELRVTLETDRTTLEFLKLQADLFGGLRAKRAVSELQFRSADAKHAAMATKIAENQKLLAQAERDLGQARLRQETYTQKQPALPMLDEALGPLRATLTVQERRIDELSVDRSMLVLTSPMDGIVIEVLRGVGEVVLTGEPILTVTTSQPTEVIAYASPAQVDRLRAAATVQLEVAREGNHRQLAESRVDAVGPTVEQLPMRLWHSPAVAEWGWPVRISLPAGLTVLCDERVGVYHE